MERMDQSKEGVCCKQEKQKRREKKQAKINGEQLQRAQIAP
jgi:hypothetical protein